MSKKFALKASQIKPLATERGGCIATDMITVGGRKVGYMVRDQPNNPRDSGWQFFSGTESQDYLDEPGNSAIYDVNTIANYDPEIISFLDASIGSSFERAGGDGPFVQVDGEPREPSTPMASSAERWPPPGFPVVEGEHVLTPTWVIHLPEPFARRVEDESLVLWRPGLTIWLSAWGNERGESQAKRLENFMREAPDARFDARENVADGITRFDYRLRETGDDGPVESLEAIILSDGGHLQMSVYFDNAADEFKARYLADRVVARRMSKV